MVKYITVIGFFMFSCGGGDYAPDTCEEYMTHAYEETCTLGETQYPLTYGEAVAWCDNLKNSVSASCKECSYLLKDWLRCRPSLDAKCKNCDDEFDRLISCCM